VRPVLGAADIFVLPSAADTFSNATLEAMAMEKPVILADVAGASEMVVSGRNGFLYPASETGKLTEILKLLAEDESKRLRMGQEGRRMAEDYFEFNGMIDNYEALLVAASTSKKFISAMVSQPIGIENEGK
jgi:glycosyltransferase involved in cell wall biosynthesis